MPRGLRRMGFTRARRGIRRRETGWTSRCSPSSKAEPAPFDRSPYPALPLFAGPLNAIKKLGVQEIEVVVAPGHEQVEVFRCSGTAVIADCIAPDDDVSNSG